MYLLLRDSAHSLFFRLAKLLPLIYLMERSLQFILFLFMVHYCESLVAFYGLMGHRNVAHLTFWYNNKNHVVVTEWNPNSPPRLSSSSFVSVSLAVWKLTFPVEKFLSYAKLLKESKQVNLPFLLLIFSSFYDVDFLSPFAMKIKHSLW